MRLLLDTHAFLWFVGGNPQFSPRVRQVVEDRDNESVLSVSGVWEMAIKIGLGKLTPHVPFPALIPGQLTRNGIALLDKAKWMTLSMSSAGVLAI